MHELSRTLPSVRKFSKQLGLTVKYVTRIRKVTGSNIRQDTDYPTDF